MSSARRVGIALQLDIDGVDELFAPVCLPFC